MVFVGQQPPWPPEATPTTHRNQSHADDSVEVMGTNVYFWTEKRPF